MNNLEDSRNEPGINASNECLIKSEKIGDIAGLACSTDGQYLGRVALQRGRHSTSNVFNLFSLTKMIKQG